MKSFITLTGLKRLKGEHVSMIDCIKEWWYDLWQYTWGFKHIHDFKYAAKCLVFKRYDLIRTGLPKTHWVDKPELILHGIMGLIVDFVEKEDCFNSVSYTGTYWVEVGTTIREVYDWWKDYPNRQKEITIALDNWHDIKYQNVPRDNILDHLNKSVDTPEEKRYYLLHDELEKKLDAEEDEMLIKVMKIRTGLWV